MNPQQVPERGAGGAPAKARVSPVRLVVVLVLVALAVVIVVQNNSRASLHLFGWNVAMPGWLWIVLLVVLGIIIGSVFPWGRRRRKSRA